jgi:propanol-preferring alcohol dehydrogenase
MGNQKTMQALQFVGYQKPLEFREVAVPEAGPGDVVIKVAGSGACQSDLHVLEMPEGKFTFKHSFPFTMGHEPAGWVDSIGPGVEGFSIGEPVVVYVLQGCGYCRNCLVGRENYCENSGIQTHGIGIGIDGAMAPYLRVPQAARHLVRLGTLNPRTVAPLADAGATSYHSVKFALPFLSPGTTAVVIGCGGLGQMSIQILKALTAATVIALDTTEERLALARELGADVTLISNPEAVKTVRKMTGGRGADVVMDIVGANATLQMSAEMVKRLGLIARVGRGGGVLPFNNFNVPLGTSVVAPYGLGFQDLTEVVELAKAQKIRTVVEQFPLENVFDAYQLMREGKLKGRAVMLPNG